MVGRARANLRGYLSERRTISVVHVRLPYRIPLTIGILVALSGCGGDGAKQSDVDALRQEVAALKQSQAELRQALGALRKARPAPLAAAAAKTGGDPERVAVYRIPINFSPRKGDEITAVTVVEFADFQCGFCQGAAGLPDQLLREFPDDVKFVFKHYPLGRHRHAFIAAKASWAAQQQGKFWEMHDLIYRGNITEIPVATLRGYAQQLGLDMERFDADMNSPKASRAVSLDKHLGKRLKIGGTPAYFVNGKRLIERSPAGLRAMVAQEIANAKRVPQP
jgi:protein-disulfide isomerase